MAHTSSFDVILNQMLKANQGKRISHFEFDGKRYWIKQVERLQGAMRFLKQDSAQALSKETHVLKQLEHQGAPVPKVVASGDGYLVIEDAGKTVRDWVTSANIQANKLQDILSDASAALANLHQMGLAHGRPALRDISWRAGHVKFIDFEANQQKGCITKQQIRDLIVYIHSLYRYVGNDSANITAAITAYRNAGGEFIWQKAQAFLASWQWLFHVCRPFKTIGGKDLKPVYWVLWQFRQP